jgi:purine-binding chemotaxis protein CheW
VDIERLVDLRFADAACKGSRGLRRPAVLQDQPDQINSLLMPSVAGGGIKDGKNMLNQEGKYLTFSMADQEYGIDILKIKEIVAMLDVRTIPRMPSYMKGVVNLRGRVIPVFDLKDKFGLGAMAADDRSCIIVLDLDLTQEGRLVGVAVDSVSEVLSIKADEIEPTPSFGMGIQTDHIMAVAKMVDGVKLLLDIDYALDTEDLMAGESVAA